jgi:hypothetical protein
MPYIRSTRTPQAGHNDLRTADARGGRDQASRPRRPGRRDTVATMEGP